MLHPSCVNPPREAKAYVPAKERDSYGMASGKSFSSSIEMVIAWPIGCAEAALIFATPDRVPYHLPRRLILPKPEECRMA